MISYRAKCAIIFDHATRLIPTELCFPFASTFSEKDIRLLSIPVRSLSNADLANVTACWNDGAQFSSAQVARAERLTSKLSAGGTYII
jgi:hypothetical protein